MKTYTLRSRWQLLQPTMLALGAVAVIGAALWYYRIPAALFDQQPSRRGLVAVPVSGSAIPAYTKVTRDHLWDPKAGSIAVVWLRPEQVGREMATRLDQILGRVLDHEKPAGYVFTEDDFLPKGTRPGLVAGIPPGKRAMRIEADKLQGLVGLRRGDRFDLISAIEIEPGNTTFGAAGPYAQQLQLQANLSNWKKQATVKVIVQNGVVVEPLSIRQVPVANRTLTQGMVVRTRPVQEIVIAVDPREVVRLTEALAVEANLQCVSRSGHPDDPEDSRTPDSVPVNPFTGQGGFRYPAVSSARPAATVPASMAPAATASASAAPAAPSAPAVYGTSGFRISPVETINGTKRDIVGAPVQGRR